MCDLGLPSSTTFKLFGSRSEISGVQTLRSRIVSSSFLPASFRRSDGESATSNVCLVKRGRCLRTAAYCQTAPPSCAGPPTDDLWVRAAANGRTAYIYGLSGNIGQLNQTRMALPPQFTTRDISGRFILNSKLSDTQDTFLPIAVSTQLLRAKLAFNHYTDENGSERICVEQEVSVGGRVASVSEDNRILDWCERPLEDPLFGRVVGRIRRIKTPLLKPPFLRAGWTADTRKHGVLQYDLCDDRHTWATDETWGIEEIAGERYFARHVRFTPGLGAEDVERRFVYDYVGSI